MRASGLVSWLLVAQAAAPLPPGTGREVVGRLAPLLQREYIFPDLADQAATRLQQRLDEGRYAAATSRESLARLLTEDLFAVTRDRHLVVNVVDVVPQSPAAAAPAESRELDARRTNFGVRQAGILPGNVGYLDLTFFFRPEEARDALASAMGVVRNSDALILDLRENGGGSPGTVALLLSYLFDAPALPLFRILHRAPAAVDAYATASPGVEGRNGSRPVWVLTSTRTFSAGEGVAFLLQERRRAEVIGERTGGAANPGRPYPIDDHFSVTVPNGRVESAVERGNWEGTGVTPDVPIAAADALQAAHVRALRTLRDQQAPGAWRDHLEQELQRLQEEPARQGR